MYFVYIGFHHEILAIVIMRTRQNFTLQLKAYVTLSCSVFLIINVINVSVDGTFV